MSINRSSLFWGLLLIASGVLVFAQQMGYIDQLSPQTAMLIFGGISLLGWVVYAVSAGKEWSWLFPAGIFGGLTATIWLATSGVDGAVVSSPIFFGLLIPFAGAYLSDRLRHWWALIPGGIMLFFGLMMLVVDRLGGEWIGVTFLLMVGLSFLVVYLTDRTRTWALLVAYIMGVLSIAPALASFDGLAAYYGSVFLLAVALPFYLVYLREAKNWWAIIPAGVLTAVAGVAWLAVSGWIRDEQGASYANALLMFGLALTFSVLWLRHHMDWAKVTAIILAGVSLASLFFASYSEFLWPLAIILAGGYLLFNAMRPKHVN